MIVTYSDASGLHIVDTSELTPNQMWASYPDFFKRDEYLERVRTDIGTDYALLFRLVELLTEGFLRFIDNGNWVGAEAYCSNMVAQAKLSQADCDIICGAMPTV